MTTNTLAQRGVGREHGRAVAIGGVIVEASAALTALVLSLFCLAGVLGSAGTGVVGIALGGALVFQGMVVGTLLRRVGRGVVARVEPETAEVGLEAVAGVVAVTLGILMLGSVASYERLLPIMAIVLGVGMIFAQCPLAEAVSGDERVTTDGQTTKGTYRAVLLASALHAFIGMSVMVLGIIELAMPHRVALSLVGFVAMSGSMLVACTAIAMRLALRRGRGMPRGETEQ